VKYWRRQGSASTIGMIKPPTGSAWSPADHSFPRGKRISPLEDRQDTNQNRKRFSVSFALTFRITILSQR
jgi:hypothetical protein